MLILNPYDTHIGEIALKEVLKQMQIWQIWAIVGFIFLFIEMMTPVLFFLTLAGASFFAGIAAYKWPDNTVAQVAAFVIFLPVFYFSVRPFMQKKDKEPSSTGIDAKYIGQTAIVTKPVGKKETNGVGEIKIYGEVWQAKSCDGAVIEPEAIVKIIKNESLIMFVEKCEN